MTTMKFLNRSEYCRSRKEFGPTIFSVLVAGVF